MRNKTLRIVADANIPLLDETFGQHGRIVRQAGRQLAADQVRDADLLLVRSVTRVGPELLSGSKLGFVGTATIGTDHLDTRWLESRDIHWANAPGCNADAAAQYTLGMMLLACQRLQKDFFSQRVGIVGLGNVGSRLRRLLDTLDIKSVACDPPLAEAGESAFSDLQTALQQDIVSLHVPLTRSGRHATFNMIGAEQVQGMRDGSLLVNTSRGDVIDDEALLRHMRAGRLHAALDVWPGEPDISTELLSLATVASPHVAGYSVEGRNNGTLAIYREYLQWSGKQPSGTAIATPATTADQALDLTSANNEQVIASAVIQSTGVQRDDRALRNTARTVPIGTGFDAMRRDYPLRRQFAAWNVTAPRGETAERLRGLGFTIYP